MGEAGGEGEEPSSVWSCRASVGGREGGREGGGKCER